MGYSREIIVYQNPRFQKGQIVELIKNLLSNGWSFKCRSDIDEIIYTLNAGDWLKINLNEEQKLFEGLNSLDINKSFGGVQLRNEKLDRVGWVYQFESRYRFELQISSGEDEKLLFPKFYSAFKSSIEELEHLFHIEWRTDYSNKIVKCTTNLYHEGVLILASSKKLRNYFKERKFSYEFPSGIEELIETNSVIVINCWDNEISTHIEIEEFSEVNKKLKNSIEFEEGDELLIMHHGDFTMICDNHNGNYKNYDYKSVISIPIETARKQVIVISKNMAENEIIFQFEYDKRENGQNELIDFKEIPTHP